MENLIDGAKKFQSEIFPQFQEVFEKLKHGQSPHTLFIGCSDSRLIPDLITRSLPGELFVVRNIANIVPRYRISSEYLATTSAIEFAILGLNVKNIVVCGHSNCGGCRAILVQSAIENMPHTRKWLEQSKSIIDNIDLTKYSNQSEIFQYIEKQNIIMQLENLMSYPFIKEKYDRNELQIFGWYFDIATGSVFNYNKLKRNFEKIE